MEIYRFRKSLMLGALALSVAFTPAWLQNVDEVVITGSHIKQSPEDAPVPIDVVDSEELFSIGNATVVDLIKTLGVSSGGDDFVTCDLHYNFSLANLTGEESVSALLVSVYSLTDEDPPRARLDLNYDPYTHNPFGRMIKVGLHHQF